jgi:hypothetical protein
MNDSRKQSNMSFYEKANFFRRAGWLENQSFCYEQQNFANLSTVLTFDGICHVFNFDEEIYDKST